LKTKGTKNKIRNTHIGKHLFALLRSTAAQIALEPTPFLFFPILSCALEASCEVSAAHFQLTGVSTLRYYLPQCKYRRKENYDQKSGNNSSKEDAYRQILRGVYGSQRVHDV
jgi:hypothetical protein